MSDLIPELHQLIGTFMALMGIGLGVIATQLIRNHNKR
jgi:hypothetical protein